MKIAKQNTRQQLFIVESDPEVAIELKGLIEDRFSNMFDIIVYHTGSAALEDINHLVDIVIINNYLLGENGTQIAKDMQENHSALKVIMLTNSDEIIIALDNHYNAVVPPVRTPPQQKEPYSWIKHSKFGYPFRYFIKEFKTRKFVAIFILTFILVGLTSLIFLMLN